MRKLAVDVGNTRMKMLLWEDGSCKEWDGCPVDEALASVTGETPEWGKALPGVKVDILNADTPLPIRLDYNTPHTLGADRKAAACGAWAKMPGKDVVIIDAGTCITIDFLSKEGIFEGGAILPGLRMKFEALHTFTARLPLLSLNGDLKMPADGITGKSTEEAMAAGVLTATRMEVAAFAEEYRRNTGEIAVVITGGDAEALAPKGATIDKQLVLHGLLSIMNQQ